MNATSSVDGKDRGEIDIGIKWKYDYEVAAALRKKKEKDDKSLVKKIGRFATGLVTDANESEDEVSLNNYAYYVMIEGLKRLVSTMLKMMQKKSHKNSPKKIRKRSLKRKKRRKRSCPTLQ